MKSLEQEWNAHVIDAAANKGSERPRESIRVGETEGIYVPIYSAEAREALVVGDVTTVQEINRIHLTGTPTL
jgi:hypothetical protein